MEPIVENDDNKILVKIDLKDTDFGPETVVSKGSYVLPMKAPTEPNDKYTLQVTLVAEDGTTLQSRNVKYKLDDTISDTSGGTGIITVTKDLYRFAINANWFYQIGSETEPVEWKEEEQNNIVITVHPNWEGVTEIPLD